MADFENENSELQRITAENVDELASIWTEMFDEEICLYNFKKLKEHVKTFFAELKEESIQRKQLIENELEELRNEADTLCRLLKPKVQLPRMEDRNVPLLTLQSDMDKSLSELREQLRRRREEICELLLEQEGLCEELGEAPRPLLADPLPSEEEIMEFRSHLDQLKVERMERLNEMSLLRREIKNYLNTLEAQVNTDADDRLLNHRQIKLNDETFTALRRMAELYGSRVHALSERIVGMRKKLESLWGRLKTSPNTRNKFKGCVEFNQRTYSVLKEELNRCESLQSQNIKECLQQIRTEIVDLWDKTLKSETERNRFSNFHSNCYTEDLLVLHEIELEDLKRFYENNRQIFELFDNRKLLWDRMEALEAKACDPGRYNNRGGQLLKEERERKTIATKLPKIEEQIKELVMAYEEQEHQEFHVHGENILVLMGKQWEKKRQEKGKMSSARKNAQTPHSVTNRTPISGKNGSLISMRKALSHINLSTVPRSASASSAKKRELNQNKNNTPLAKRSLIFPVNSPSISTKPMTNVCNTASAVGSKLPMKSSFKPPLKKTRVIATMIRRRSGRQSSGIKNRFSLYKRAKKKAIVAPKILINDESEWSTDESTDEAYESFQKSIAPDSRSSIVHTTVAHKTSTSNFSTRSKRNPNENRVIHLPDPRSGFNHLPTLSKMSPGSSSRKLKTKNLPIII
ncbi:PREDICTED: protein regulator of cytokinesis 1-like [Rhagoletis zephyria]|uniref:protein regulator of cytokinesis 1-like n=1 Tax=Rhagoletis zephyria TaxID=28612 RepID=UPI0008118CBB|nr:PREDICTED: protein regulator of cytokinesis 1-like [Rhagoletis zephyria]XP_017474686.1 PREDICTED: protein regulator of cytokinesis 1-like [Rhagoletis zephyria]